MKKTIIAGVASVALAATPIVGAFATERTITATDNLSATIQTACSFLRYGAAGATQTDVTGPSWDGPTSAGAADNDATGTGTNLHAYSASLKPGADATLGTSTFTGYCNDAAGFSVTVVTPDLSDGGSPANTIEFSGTAINSTTGEGWTLTKSNGDLFSNTGADTVFMSASGPTDSADPVTETATYDIYTNSTTKSGTYTGAVVYTFTYEDPNV